jgi:hypothetical protein
MAPRDLAPATGGTTMIYGSIQQKTTKKQGKEKRGNTMELKGPVFGFPRQQGKLNTTLFD